MSDVDHETDRVMLMAILNAICGLAQKLTGEIMVVSVPCEDGTTLNIRGNGVTWISPSSFPADWGRYRADEQDDRRAHWSRRSE